MHDRTPIVVPEPKADAWIGRFRDAFIRHCQPDVDRVGAQINLLLSPANWPAKRAVSKLPRARQPLVAF